MVATIMVEGVIALTLSVLNISAEWKDILGAGSLVVCSAPFIYRLLILGLTLEAKDGRMELYQSLVEQTLQGVMITDEHMTILDVNKGFCRATGYQKDEVVGRTPRILQSGKQSPEFYREMWSQIRATGHWEGEIWNRRKNGEIYAEWLNITAIENPAKRVKHYVGIFMDITQHKVVEQQLRDLNSQLLVMTNTDSLTKIPNRRFFDDRLLAEWSRRGLDKTGLCVMMIDIDCFKEYNDQYGHLAGDECLKLVTTTINRQMDRPGDLVSRYGGEEFAVILPATGIDEGRGIAERIRKGVEDLQIVHADAVSEPYITISVGVSHTIPTDNLHASSLVAAADQALYQAKRIGKNRVVIFAG